MALQRRQVTFQGNVQGVGFRYTTSRLAAAFDVTGYVKNLPDGRVEVVAEGDRDEIDRFIKSIRKEFSRCIRNVGQQSAAPQGEFRGFSVRH